MELFSYRNESVIRKIMEEGYTETEANVLFDDMLKFLYVAQTSNEPCSPTKKIDIAWHHFILHTKDYMSFCEQYFGGYVHHSPTSPGEKPKESPNLRERAQKLFGALSPNWDTSTAKCEKCACRPNCEVNVPRKRSKETIMRRDPKIPHVVQH